MPPRLLALLLRPFIATITTSQPHPHGASEATFFLTGWDAHGNDSAWSIFKAAVQAGYDSNTSAALDARLSLLSPA